MDKRLILAALASATDTKACEIGVGATAAAAVMFRSLFPEAKEVLLVADPRTYAVAGKRVEKLLVGADLAVKGHLLGQDGRPFHAEYKYIDELRTAYLARFPNGGVPMVAVGSGTVNDLVKRTAEEVGVRYMTVGTAASMDGYTSFGAAITKDGMKQTLSCRAPIGCIVDSEVAAAAPKAMTASGYADLLAKIPAGADWLIADALGYEKVHPLAWRLVQGPLREALANPLGAASRDVSEIEKLCAGLVMSGFAMQAMNSSRPASGTEHQVAHYWDMEDLAFAGQLVSHGFKVGIGTLVSTKTLEFLLRQDLAALDVKGIVARWFPTFEAMKATFPAVYGNRPAHICRAGIEMSKKYVTPSQLAVELTALKAIWPELKLRLAEQLIPFDEVRERLRQAGAPYEPEQIGVSRARFRETYLGVSYMRSRYFGLDSVARLGLLPALIKELFGVGGIWEVK